MENNNKSSKIWIIVIIAAVVAALTTVAIIVLRARAKKKAYLEQEAFDYDLDDCACFTFDDEVVEEISADE